MSRDTKKLATGIGLGLSVVGGFWGMALVAANLVMSPHVAQARERVKFMCAWAQEHQERMRRTDANAYAACVATVGLTACHAPPEPVPNPLLDKCEEK